MLGHRQTESGRLSVLNHLWVHADLDDRFACRAALAADADWTQGFGPRALPMIERQENVLTLREGSPTSRPELLRAHTADGSCAS
jgi:hypothetical protein